MLTFIPTPIGNPQDITIRAMRLFEKATLFLCEDTRHTKRLLRGERLVEQAVVYVSDAGMPIISDPGQLLVAYCQEQGIAYDVLPGASAVTTAYAASGFESGKFCFFAFLPHKGKERATALDEALSSGYNTVLYEAPHRLVKLLDEIEAVDASRELFLAKEISKRYQTYYRGSVVAIKAALAEVTIRHPCQSE